MNILFVNEYPFNPLYGGIERVTDLLCRSLNVRHNCFYLANILPDDEILKYTFPAPLYILPKKSSLDEKKEFVHNLITKYNINIIINQRGQNPVFIDFLSHEGVKLINVIHNQPSSFIFTDLNRPLIKELGLIGETKYYIKKTTWPIYKLWRKYRLVNMYSDFFTKSLSSSSKLVLLSAKDKAELKQIVGNFDETKVVGISNPNTFDYYNCNLDKKEKTILYVSRLSRLDKNPMRMLKIWERLYREFPDWELVVVGDGEMKKEMLGYLSKHKIERTKFYGSQRDVSRFYMTASFICLASNVEGWGMTLTEGMQHGCIPFTFNSYGAASDIIDDGVNGCLITPFSLDEYVVRLSELMNNEEKRRSMAEAATEKAKQFDINLITEEWESLFKNIL